MIDNNKKVELLAPAGSLDKMKYAFAFGADAVYLGSPDFSLRARINKFSEKEIAEGVAYAHKSKKKVYVTLNIYAHNQHLEKIKNHLQFLKKIKPDGIIVSDPGIIMLCQKYLPEMEIHLSTQANATNWEAVEFWQKQGVKRIILAREVSLSEIKEIKQKVPHMELEYFIHGAMCMSYSGRCILSKWMNNRSANLGDCSQPCRWKYKELNIKDDQERFGVNVEEDKHGTYFFNSYDMNLIEHVDKLVAAGVTSLKIEGRAKSAYYVAVVVRAYRKVLKGILVGEKKEKLKKIIKEQKKELDYLIHRGYSTGFLLGNEPPHNFSGELQGGDFEFVGEILGSEDKLNIVKVHNSVFSKDQVEVVTPEKNISAKVKKILDEDKNEVKEAHGGHQKLYFFQFDEILPVGSLIRKKL